MTCGKATVLCGGVEKASGAEAPLFWALVDAVTNAGSRQPSFSDAVVRNAIEAPAQQGHGLAVAKGIGNHPTDA